MSESARQSNHRPASKPRPPLDEARLHALALHYVGRYATTQRRLADYLERKLRERGWADGNPSDGNQAIFSLVEQFVERGYVDDQAFATARAASLVRRGYGASRVRVELKQAGIATEQVLAASTIDPESALAAAFQFARRKRIGPFARVLPDKRARDRALAACLRAGHSFADARTVLESSPDFSRLGDE